MLEKYNLDNATTNKIAELDKKCKSKYNTTFTKVVKRKLLQVTKTKTKQNSR